MSRRTEILSQLKYWGSRSLTPNAYWYLMGKLKPVRAVTSRYDTVEDCIASGEQVVALLGQLDVLHAESVTLHIGSGLGRVEYHLRQRVRKCYGVDISASMVQRARRLVPFDDVEFRRTDGSGLVDWPDGFFDVIYSFLVFQHLPRPQFERYVREARPKLSSGGHLVFQLLVDETGARPDPPPAHPYGIRYYGRADVEELLASAGFARVVRTSLSGEVDDGSSAVADVVFCATRE